jgi:hypothetical protein
LCACAGLLDIHGYPCDGYRICGYPWISMDAVL